jgi:gliding motility-associated-like protein
VTGDVTDEGDNCDTSLDATFTDNVVAGSCEGEEIITRTWSLTDDCGNTTTQVQTITVEDNTSPDFVVPPTDTICRTTGCLYDIDPIITGQVTGITDNCSTGLMATFTDDLSHLTSCDTAGYVIRTWRLDDNCGNFTEKQQVIWVEPLSTVTATPNEDTICSGGTVDFTLLSITEPTRPVLFRYITLAEPGVAITPASGTGLINGTRLTNSIANNLPDVQRVKFVITPYIREASGEVEKCSGISDTVDVWVEPTVTVTGNHDTICNGASTNILLHSNNITSFDIRYTWTVNDDPFITGESNSTPDGQSISEPLDQTLINNGNTARLITYHITPWTADPLYRLTCMGIPFDLNIWVEPTPTVIANPGSDTICSGDRVDINLASGSTPTQPSRYRYTTQVPSGITVNPGSGQNLGDGIIDDIILNNTDTAKRVLFFITPYSLTANGLFEKCAGITDTVEIWVEPVVRFVPQPVHDTLCSGEQVGIGFISSSQTTAGIRLDYRAIPDHPMAIAGFSDGAGLTIDSTIVQTLTNLTDTAQRIIYRITAFTVDANGNPRCTGTIADVDIWLEPMARITGLPEGDTLCSGNLTDIHLDSPTVPLRDVEVNLFVLPDNPGAVSGMLPLSQLSKTAVIAQRLENHTDSAQRILYVFTPVTGGNGHLFCTGISDTVEIWVEPVLHSALTPGSDTLCDGTTTALSVSSRSVPTLPVRFRYTVLPDHPASLIYNPNLIAGKENGDTLAENFVNLTDTAQRVLVEVTPYSVDNNGLERCSGVPVNSVIWIEPTPKVSLSHPRDTICTGLHPEQVLSTVTRSLHPIQFRYETVYDPAFVSVAHNSADGLEPGDAIADTLVNLTPVPQMVMVIVHPYLSGPGGSQACTGIPDTSRVWIAPELLVMADSISTYIGGRNIRCFGQSNGSIYLHPQGGVTGFGGYDVFDLTYSWNNGRNTKDITGLKAGSYLVTITDKLHCTGDSTFTLTQPARLTSVVEVIDTLSCLGNDGTIAPLTTGGTEGYQYIWTVPIDYVLDSPVYTDSLFNVLEGHYVLQIYDTNNCAYSTTYDLSQPSAVWVGAFPENYGNYQIKCHGDQSGKWTTVNSSMINITYHWTGPNGFDTIFTNTNRFNYDSNLFAGRYTLYYTDAAGCAGIYVVDLNEPDPLEIGTIALSDYHGRYNVSCSGSRDGSATLQTITGGHESSGYTYLWNSLAGEVLSNPTNRNQVGLAPGDYMVSVADTFGCAVTDTISLTGPTPLETNPELSLSTGGTYNLNCYGEHTGKIQVHPSGGNTLDGPYQIRWATGETTPELTSLPAGSYQVTITDGIGCSLTDTITLTQPGKMGIDSSTVSDYNGFGVLCAEGSNGSIRVYPSGGEGMYTYDWSRDGSAAGADSSYIEGLQSGVYVLSLRDANQCSISWSDTLDAPAAIHIIQDVVQVNCTGSRPGSVNISASGGTGSYTYLWDSGETTPALNGLSAGSYGVTVTDDNLCQKFDTVWIIQNPMVVANIQIMDSVSCNGKSDGVLAGEASSGIAPFTYQWNTGWEGATLTGAGEGTYMITVTDADGCSDSYTLVLNDPETLLPGFIVTDTRCAGSEDGSAILAASGGTADYTFLWNRKEVDGNQVENLASGAYLMEVLDVEGCKADTLVYIGEPDALHVAPDLLNTVVPFCPDWQNGALAVRVQGGTPIYQYQWAGFPGGDEVLSGIREGEYSLHVTDVNGCSVDTMLVLTSLNNNCLGIPTAFSPNYDYANDTWEITYISEDGSEVALWVVYPDANLQVYDRLGNLVYRCTGGCQENWNGEDAQGRLLPVDTYYYILDLHRDTPVLKGIITLIR